jgi:hypothetical protein
MWEPETRHQIRGVPMSHFQEWQFAFVEEWLRLSEGCADLLQTADVANELYAANKDRDPAELAREEWG